MALHCIILNGISGLPWMLANGSRCEWYFEITQEFLFQEFHGFNQGKHLVGKPEGKDHSEDIGVDGNLMLNCIS